MVKKERCFIFVSAKTKIYAPRVFEGKWVNKTGISRLPKLLHFPRKIPVQVGCSLILMRLPYP